MSACALPIYSPVSFNGVNRQFNPPHQRSFVGAGGIRDCRDLLDIPQYVNRGGRKVRRAGYRLK
jgi:hypothetical protein